MDISSSFLFEIIRPMRGKMCLEIPKPQNYPNFILFHCSRTSDQLIILYKQQVVNLVHLKVTGNKTF